MTAPTPPVWSAGWKRMGKHPIGLVTTWVARTFTVETARASVDTVADVLTAVATPGTSAIPESEWFDMYIQSVGSQLKLRSTTPLDISP